MKENEYILCLFVSTALITACGASTSTQKDARDRSDLSGRQTAIAPDDSPETAWQKLLGSRVDMESSGGSGVSEREAGGRPSVKIAVEGQLTKSHIKQVVSVNLPRVEECYLLSLLEAPAISGSIRINFIVNADGTVPWAAVGGSTLNNVDLEECIIGAILKLVFLSAEGAEITAVSFPIRLSVEGGRPIVESIDDSEASKQKPAANKRSE